MDAALFVCIDGLRLRSIGLCAFETARRRV
jgi:hypothetical protein